MPSVPPGGYAVPGPTVPAAPYAGAANGSTWQPASSALAAQQAAPARPIVRGQMDEEPRPVLRPPAPSRAMPLSIPSPEELGVPGPRPVDDPPLDWAAVHARLGSLGATCFHLERPPQGGYRVSCLLPTSQQGRMHRIDADAASEADAVRLVLAKAEEWAGGR